MFIFLLDRPEGPHVKAARPFYGAGGLRVGYFRLKWARRFLTQQDSTDSVQTGFSLP